MRTVVSALRAALVAGLFLAGAGTVAYAGMWTGLPAASDTAVTGQGSANRAATLPLTGNETGAFDTNLSQGRNPQTETISVDQLKTYMYGNSGTAGLTANTTATAVSGAATCNAARCIVTTDSLAHSQGSSYTLNVSSTNINSTSMFQVTIGNGTNTASGSNLNTATRVCSGTNCAARILIQNLNSTALNGTLLAHLLIIN